jgi:ATP-binding cassette subfamily B protein
MGLSQGLPVAAVPAKMPSRLRGEIVIDHVTFCYPGSTREALSNVSARILPGETLAIVGANGAGKTTLFKLICRLYDPTEGRILIDGVDIREYAPEALRRHISVMLQDFVVYQATVAENIGYGDIERINDHQAIRGSARRAGANQLIERLPDGYKTALGKWFERGVSLSGGDGQRIGLARAFMRDAAIILLDEPTASLDAEAEYDLVSRLRALTTGRTTIYISHRFSTVRYADRILVLEDGRVSEQGTHTELISLCGRYARLYRMQASAFDSAKETVA